MKTIVPDYYPMFRCRAGACRHTCCAGWEIDIDEKTLESYKSVGGSLGKRMKNGISDGHFVLDAAERCPFLNAGNLCDIITELGETALCQVCSDHPRFRNFITGRTEMGVGLTCEAAADLILTRKEPAAFMVLEDDLADDAPGDSEADILALRDAMLDIARDRSLDIGQRLLRLAETAGIDMPSVSLTEWADIYLGLERLDESWTQRLLEAKKAAPSPVDDETALEQLLVYLIFRHILPACQDDDPEGRTAFVISSLEFIRLLGGNIADTARMWSSEIEYSDENIGALTDACFQ